MITAVVRRGSGVPVKRNPGSICIVAFVSAVLVFLQVMSGALGGDGPLVFRAGKPGRPRSIPLGEAKPFRTQDGKSGWCVRVSPGQVLATPAVVDGVVYVGGAVSDHALFAIDARTGRRVWSYETGDNGPTSPVVSGRYLSYSTQSCTLYVHDRLTGQLVWSRWLGDPLISMPAMDDERIFVTYPNSDSEHHLCALLLRNGTVAWDRRIESEILTAPVVDADSVYAAMADGTLARFDAKTGRRRWAAKCGVTAAPRVAGNLVFISQRWAANDGSAPAERPRDKAGVCEGFNMIHAETGEAVLPTPSACVDAPYLWTVRGRDGTPADGGSDGAGEGVAKSSLEMLWGWQGSVPCPVGLRVFVANGSVVRSLHPMDGSVYWQHEARVKANSRPAISPPAVVGDKVYVGTADGAIVCIRARSGEVAWTAQVGGSMTCQPAIAGGRVYIVRSDGVLVCLDTGDPAADGWTMWGGSPRHNGPAQDKVRLASARLGEERDKQ